MLICVHMQMYLKMKFEEAKLAEAKEYGRATLVSDTQWQCMIKK